jgi:pimeloyl-ACP methyl ester carboxylesterase
MKQIYLFSGLGADERVFQLIDFSGFEIAHVQWIKPHVHETLENYVQRLSEKITSTRPTFIGVSFGGIVALEMAKLIETEKIIIISSVKTHVEIPFCFRLLAPLKLHRIIPDKFFKKPNSTNYKLFGCENKQSKDLLNEILHDTDPRFLKWAIDEIMRWKNEYVPKNLIHIHGTADKIFPHSSIKCDIRIENGGHFMVFDKAREITEVLRPLLKGDTNHRR